MKHRQLGRDGNKGNTLANSLHGNGYTGCRAVFSRQQVFFILLWWCRVSQRVCVRAASTSNYFDDLPIALKSNDQLFADDSVIYKTIKYRVGRHPAATGGPTPAGRMGAEMGA